MIETVEHPVFTAKDFDRAHKKPGLSAIVRLKNEAEFAKAALESIAPFFDEIIIVFNDCTDRTPEIVAEFAECHANRVRAFHYVPQVVPIATKEHQRTPSHSPHSIVYYCNFALSKASYQICCKWDGDQIADPRGFQQITQYLRQLQPGSRDWWLSPWRMGYLWFTGINLWSARGQLFVHKVRPFAGWKHDIGF
ncbi:MAG TPA: hypothetical protein VFD70_31605, partial [Anaerolineae bacterium]|nr:hypothetical protein [Anaerolineae bacterium]